MNIIQTIEAAGAAKPLVTDEATLTKLCAPLAKFRSSCRFAEFLDDQVAAPMSFRGGSVLLRTQSDKSPPEPIDEALLHRADLPSPPPYDIDRTDHPLRRLQGSPGRDSFSPKPVEVRVQALVPRSLPAKITFPETLENGIAENLGGRFALSVEHQYVSSLAKHLLEADRVQEISRAEARAKILALALEFETPGLVLANPSDSYKLFGLQRAEEELPGGATLQRSHCLGNGVVVIMAATPQTIGFIRAQSLPSTYAFVQDSDPSIVVCATIGQYAFGVWGDAPMVGVRVLP